MAIHLLNGSWEAETKTGAIKYYRFSPDTYSVYTDPYFVVEEMKSSIKASKSGDGWVLETPFGIWRVISIDQENMVLEDSNGLNQKFRRIEPVTFRM